MTGTLSPLKISQRGLSISPSPIRKLYSLANKTKERGIKVLHMNIGQPDLPVHPLILNEIKSIFPDIIDYAPSEGLIELRKMLAAFYNQYSYLINPDDIIITTGGSEAIWFTFSIVADPGDEIIVFEPFYPNYRSFAQMLSIKIIPLTLSMENSFALPAIDDIEKKISSKTKAIIICNPSNPTGSLLSKNDIEKILYLAEKHNLYVISDEAYRELVYDEKPSSLIEYEKYHERIIIIDSFSKKFSLCGIRVGMIVTKNKLVIENIKKLAQARLSPPLIGQLVAIAALKNAQPVIENVKQKFAIRRQKILEVLSDIKGIEYAHPKGAFYVFIKLPLNNVEHYCEWLLTNYEYNGYTLMLAPGPGFFINTSLGNSFARIAYVLEPNFIETAGKILKDSFKSYIT